MYSGSFDVTMLTLAVFVLFLTMSKKLSFRIRLYISLKTIIIHWCHKLDFDWL